MPDDIYGRAYVEIWPDLSKFKNILRRKAPMATRGVKFLVPVVPDISETKNLLRRKVLTATRGIKFKVPVVPDISNFRETLRRHMLSVTRGVEARVKVVPDLTEFCRRLRGSLPVCLGTQYRIIVVPDYTGFCVRLQRMMPRCPGVEYRLPVTPPHRPIPCPRPCPPIIIPRGDETERSIDRLRDKFSGLGATIVRTIGRAVAVITSFTSVLGPMLNIMTASVLSTVNFVAAISPLVAMLPSVALGLGLVKGTAMLAGPALLEAFKPITDLFSEGVKKGGVLTGVGVLRTRIGELASRGIPELAQAFVKVNMPTIGRGMERIAIAMNATVRAVGTWINTISGQQTIRMIVDATALAVERLAPKVAGLVIALGAMVLRLGSGAITGLGDVLGRAADSATRLINSITREDIARGMQTLRDAADAVFGKLIMIWNVLQFIANSEGKIKAVTDALAGIGIALGAVTGYWPAVVAGAVTLILNHFNSIKNAGLSIWRTLSNDPTVRILVTKLIGYWGEFKTAFSQVFGYMIRIVMPLFRVALENIRASIDTLRKSGVNWSLVFRVAGATLAVLAGIILGVVVAALAALTWQIRIATLAIGPLWRAFQFMTRVFLNAVGTMISGAARAFGWIPGIGPKLREAERQFNAFRDSVNRSLSGVRGREVAVNVKSMINGQQVSITTRGEIVQIKSRSGTTRARAAGGPVYGPGGPTDDQVPALGPGGTKYRLSNGEYVLRASTVRKIGIPQLNAINRYAAGGPVGLNVRAGISTTSYAPISMIIAKIVAGMGRSIGDSLKNAITTSGFGAGVGAGPTSVSGNAALGRSMAAALYGWVGAQWGALYRLWQGESGWNAHAHNPSSGAHGIPQSLPASKMASAGADYYTNPATQIRWGLGYIRERYGSPLAALAAWQRRSPHWYDDGGVLPPGLTMAYNGTGRNEYVSKEPTGTVINNYYQFPNYLGDKSDLVSALNELRRQGRLQFT